MSWPLAMVAMIVTEWSHGLPAPGAHMVPAMLLSTPAFSSHPCTSASGTDTVTPIVLTSFIRPQLSPSRLMSTEMLALVKERVTSGPVLLSAGTERRALPVTVYTSASRTMPKEREVSLTPSAIGMSPMVAAMSA
ncbi:hypothetical protein DFJ74DRAFT_660510 [Hyaloraphidium curvatum]|nr:hypothetical protein DFJ74DRAFT_660496 [Hyaloraphidium curvatum]KAI9027807.1 hypothetical protein DFJ74DRAFT_660510 [Hyaloraphidium curvatum]